MKRRVLVLDVIQPEAAALLEPICDLIRPPSLEPAALIEAARGAEAIIIKALGRVSREMIDAAEPLKVVARQGVGVDNIDLEAARARGVRVINSPEGNTLAMAEHFIMLALGTARRVTALNRWLREGDWSGLDHYAAAEMTGRTLGVLGFGHIGQLVTKICSAAFHMPALYASRQPHDEAARALGAVRVEVEALFERSDFLAICLALTPDTRHLVDGRLMSRMKSSAYLINLSRGGVWNEEHLCRALKEGTIAGAASDVYEIEPAGPDHPLFACDNFFGTPHSGALTAEALARIDLDVARNVLNVLAGRPPAHPVV